MIGATAETLSRKLNYLESMGIITVRKRRVNILDLKALNQMAEMKNRFYQKTINDQNCRIQRRVNRSQHGY